MRPVIVSHAFPCLVAWSITLVKTIVWLRKFWCEGTKKADHMGNAGKILAVYLKVTINILKQSKGYVARRIQMGNQLI